MYDNCKSIPYDMFYILRVNLTLYRSTEWKWMNEWIYIILYYIIILSVRFLYNFKNVTFSSTLEKQVVNDTGLQLEMLFLSLFFNRGFTTKYWRHGKIPVNKVWLQIYVSYEIFIYVQYFIIAMGIWDFGGFNFFFNFFICCIIDFNPRQRTVKSTEQETHGYINILVRITHTCLVNLLGYRQKILTAAWGICWSSDIESSTFKIYISFRVVFLPINDFTMFHVALILFFEVIILLLKKIF